MKYRLDEDNIMIEGDCFIAETAVVIGKVKLEKDTSIWFGSILRGDNEIISVRRRNKYSRSFCPPHGFWFSIKNWERMYDRA